MLTQSLAKIATASLALSMFACGPGPETGVEGSESDSLKTAAQPSYQLRATTAAVTSTSPVWGSTFVISSTTNLNLATDFSGLASGHHKASLFFYAPDTSLYQRNNVAFAVGVAPAAGEVSAQKTATGYRIWTSLPVAGTNIDMYSMTGVWSGQTWIDAAASANAKLSFTLQ